MSDTEKDGLTCPCCGAKTVEYKHSLTKSLIRTLVVFLKMGDGFHNLSNTALNHNQRCNFPKLQYWNFIQKVDEPDCCGVQWKITDTGMDFLRNESLVSKVAITYRGNFKRYEGKNVCIVQLSGGWKYRNEYAGDAVAHVEN